MGTGSGTSNGRDGNKVKDHDYIIYGKVLYNSVTGWHYRVISVKDEVVHLFCIETEEECEFDLSWLGSWTVL